MALAVHAQGIVEWQANVARWQSAEWDCGRGETLHLMPSFLSGRDAIDLSGLGEATFHWQTNGMGGLYWSVPARIDTGSRPHRLVADFEPWMDCGAAKYDYFFRAGATNGPVQYRAHGTIRMRGAPGAVPNALPLPVQVLDFAKVSVTNAPWGEGGGTDGEAVTNIVEGIVMGKANNPFIPDWGGFITNRMGYVGFPEGYPFVDIAHTNGLGGTTSRLVAMPDKVFHSDGTNSNYYHFPHVGGTGNLHQTFALQSDIPDSSGFLRTTGDQGLAGTLTISRHTRAGGSTALGASSVTIDNEGLSVEKADAVGSTTYGRTAITRGSGTVIDLPESSGTIALTTDIPSTDGLASAEEVAAARMESSLVYQLMMGSNVVAEVTNYNSSVRSPQLRLLQLEEGEYRTVWAETNGLSRTLQEANRHADDAVAELAGRKADRAWGKYTSGLGSEAPSNTTWVSTPVTVIAGGYEYAKVITSAGEAWVLCSNGLNAGPDTNAYFRVATLDGESLFSVERSESVLIGVRAGGITCSGNTVSIPLDVVSAEAPVCYACDDLVSQNWVNLAESLPSWVTSASASGSAGSWVWTIETTATKGFFQFRALQEGRTVIRNNAPAELSQGIWVNGSRYVPVANGSTLTWTLAQ